MSMTRALQFRKKAGVSRTMEAVMAALEDGPKPTMLVVAHCQKHGLCSPDSARNGLSLAIKKKYVRQLVVKGDARYKRLTLTPKGNLYIKAFGEQWNG